MPEELQYDAFAAARLEDSLKIFKEREINFQVADHTHTAYQDLSGGGWIEETVTIRWRPKPIINGHSHGRGSD